MTLTDIENLGETATMDGPLNARFARELARVVNDYINGDCTFERKNEIIENYFSRYLGTDVENDAWSLEAKGFALAYTK